MAWKSSSAVLALLVAGSLAASEPQRFEAAQPHMGTLFRITLYAPDQAAADIAFRAAFHRVAELDAILSDYKPQSELMRLSSHAPGEAVPVSEDLYAVLSAARHLAEQTDGAFDVTLGPAIRVWRQARIDRRLPDPKVLAEALRHTGYRKLALDPQRRTVTLQEAGMLLDVGGIAKGYAADEALKCLRTQGITRALVAASGDLAIGDAPPGKQGWRVGVDLDNTGGPFARVLLLENAAVSTSGDTEQYLDIDGTRYSHIIDPKTGTGLTTRLAVTIVAGKGILADGIATAASVLGLQRGLAFVESQSGVAALFLTPSGFGASSGFRKLRSAASGNR